MTWHYCKCTFIGHKIAIIEAAARRWTPNAVFLLSSLQSCHNSNEWLCIDLTWICLECRSKFAFILFTLLYYSLGILGYRKGWLHSKLFVHHYCQKSRKVKIFILFQTFNLHLTYCCNSFEDINKHTDTSVGQMIQINALYDDNIVGAKNDTTWIDIAPKNCTKKQVNWPDKCIRFFCLRSWRVLLLITPLWRDSLFFRRITRKR